MNNLINTSTHAGLLYAVKASLSQDARFETISNNLANIETPGYKADEFSFDESLNEVISTNYTEGQNKHTGNSLDVALNSSIFFSVDTQNGTRYTKAGNFTLDAERTLVTQNGDPVLGENGPITINGEDFTIDDKGGVWVDGTNVSTLALYDFGPLDPDAEWTFSAPGATYSDLKKEGSTYYRFDGEEDQLRKAENPMVSQGFLEQSNVFAIGEMVKMIDTQRSYESYNKILQAFIETDKKATGEVARLAG